jgi:hypothetical protein
MTTARFWRKWLRLGEWWLWRVRIKRVNSQPIAFRQHRLRVRQPDEATLVRSLTASPAWVRRGVSSTALLTPPVHDVRQALQRGRPRTVIHLVCKGHLTDRFFLKDRRSVSDQIFSSLASSGRAFILVMRDRDRANKSEIEIFVFSVTSKDFPRHMLTLAYRFKNMVP